MADENDGSVMSANTYSCIAGPVIGVGSSDCVVFDASAKLETDSSGTRCMWGLISYPRTISDWWFVARLFCLQYEGCEEWFGTFSPFHGLFSSALGVVKDKIKRGENSTERVRLLAQVFRFEVSRNQVCADDRSLHRMFDYIVSCCEEN